MEAGVRGLIGRHVTILLASRFVNVTAHVRRQPTEDLLVQVFTL